MRRCSICLRASIASGERLPSTSRNGSRRCAKKHHEDTKARRRMLFSLVLIVGLTSVAGPVPAEDWSASPEAYFLTSQERQEWKSLRSDEAREQFQREYWRRRDPTPGTERN